MHAPPIHSCCIYAGTVLQLVHIVSLSCCAEIILPILPHSWFHGKISREQAEALLAPYYPEGLFLLRESTSFPGDYTLCVCSAEARVEHYRIMYCPHSGKLTIDEDDYFNTLPDLIQVVARMEGS